MVASTVVLLAGFTATFLWGTRRSTIRLPTYKQLTFQRGMVLDARFTSDGNTVVYSALWDGNRAETFSMRPERPESLSLGLPPARLYGVSRQGELAILLGKPGERRFVWHGTLARVPLSGGAPREIFEDVWSADWSPDGHDLAVIRRVEGEYQLEYPIGRVLIRPLPGVVVAGFAFRVSPRGDKVAFTTSEGITIVDRAGKASVLSTSETTLGLAWDPSGDAIWTAREATTGASTGLWRIALDGKVRQVARVPGNAMIHDVSSEGRLLIHHGFTYVGARAKAPGEAGEHDVAVHDDNNDIALTADGSRLLLYDGSESNLGWAFLRPTRGGAAIRVAAGWPLGLSPDGKWVLVRRDEENVAKVVLVPTGPGEQRVVPTEGLRNVGSAWFLDATHVLLNAAVEGRPWRTFLLDLAGGSRSRSHRRRPTPCPVRWPTGL